jgi:hypothetical protein
MGNALVDMYREGSELDSLVEKVSFDRVVSVIHDSLNVKKLVPLGKLDTIDRCIDAMEIVHTYQGKLSFIEGGILYRIDSKRLYLSKCNSFKDFVETEWNMSERYAYMKIAAFKVIENLVLKNFSVLPNTESQARELADLPPAVQVEVWKRVVEKSKGKKITASFVKGIKEDYIKMLCAPNGNEIVEEEEEEDFEARHQLVPQSEDEDFDEEDEDTDTMSFPYDEEDEIGVDSFDDVEAIKDSQAKLESEKVLGRMQQNGFNNTEQVQSKKKSSTNRNSNDQMMELQKLFEGIEKYLRPNNPLRAVAVRKINEWASSSQKLF